MHAIKPSVIPSAHSQARHRMSTARNCFPSSEVMNCHPSSWNGGGNLKPLLSSKFSKRHQLQCRRSSLTPNHCSKYCFDRAITAYNFLHNPSLSKVQCFLQSPTMDRKFNPAAAGIKLRMNLKALSIFISVFFSRPRITIIVKLANRFRTNITKLQRIFYLCRR